MKTVAGLDVHKDSVYLCILRENGEKTLIPQHYSLTLFISA